jgi:hypothetical protein
LVQVPQEQLAGTEAEVKVTKLLLAAVEQAVGLPPGSITTKVLHCKLQLWGAALPINRWTSDYAWDAAHAIGIAGDWLAVSPDQARGA